MDANAAEHVRWNDTAWTQAWLKREVLTDSVTSVLLDTLRLRPGERVIDIGCGGGRATIAAWRGVQPSGRVVGVDISADLLALAGERASGGSGIRWQQADMQTDRIDGEDFDVAMSQFGVMFFDEPMTAFANIRGHLRRGGRLGFSCWQTIDRNPWFVGPTVAAYVPAPPRPAPGKSATGPFSLGDPDRVRQVLTEAGFDAITIDPRENEIDVPLGAVIDDAQLVFMGVTPERMDEARGAVASQMSRFVTVGDQHRFPLAYQIVTARSRI